MSTGTTPFRLTTPLKVLTLVISAALIGDTLHQVIQYTFLPFLPLGTFLYMMGALRILNIDLTLTPKMISANTLDS